jgi:hypothetical protein
VLFDFIISWILVFINIVLRLKIDYCNNRNCDKIEIFLNCYTWCLNKKISVLKLNDLDFILLIFIIFKVHVMKCDKNIGR